MKSAKEILEKREIDPENREFFSEFLPHWQRKFAYLTEFDELYFSFLERISLPLSVYSAEDLREKRSLFDQACEYLESQYVYE